MPRSQPEHTGRDVIDDSFMVLVFIPLGAWRAWRGVRRHVGGRRIGLEVALAAYLSTLVGLAFFPLPVEPEVILSRREMTAPFVSLVPFATIRVSLGLGFEWPAARFLLGNVVAFMPLGSLLPLLAPSRRSWRTFLPVAFGLSLAIELAQLGISLGFGYAYRIADVDDLILNVAGAALGFAAFLAATAIATRVRSRGDPSVTAAVHHDDRHDDEERTTGGTEHGP